jgi:predicted dehydrogenase
MEQNKTSGKPMRTDMKILVVGCGSMGKRHIGNLLSIKSGEVIACDISEKKLNAVKKEFSIEGFLDLNKALSNDHYNVAFICTPPSLHVNQAMQLLDSGSHCFIEKPLSNGLEGIDDLISLSELNRRTVMVGYNLRFSPSLLKIKNLLDQGAIGRVLVLRAAVGYYLPYWRPVEDYRKGYGSKQALGGGIILDGSHEIDYVQYLLGEVKEVFSVCERLSGLEIDTEDFAEIIMRFQSGAYAQVHLDYLQSNYRRNCEIVGDAGMLTWDINERQIRQYGLRDKEYHLYYEGLNTNVNDMYIEEIKRFFACIENGTKPPIDLKEGKRVQEVIAMIKRSSELRQFVSR